MEGKKRVKLGEFQGAGFDLSKCAGGEYPDTEDRLQYMHSFALSQNYVILPLTSYLIEYCQIMGNFMRNFTFTVFFSNLDRNLVNFLLSFFIMFRYP